MISRYKILNECKKCRIKSIVTKLLNEIEVRKKYNLVEKVKIKNDTYEMIASGYDSILKSEHNIDENIAFRKVAMLMDEIEEKNIWLKEVVYRLL